jgi:hypothetical protein
VSAEIRLTNARGPIRSIRLPRLQIYNGGGGDVCNARIQQMQLCSRSLHVHGTAVGTINGKGGFAAVHGCRAAEERR